MVITLLVDEANHLVNRQVGAENPSAALGAGGAPGSKTGALPAPAGLRGTWAAGPRSTFVGTSGVTC